MLKWKTFIYRVRKLMVLICICLLRYFPDFPASVLLPGKWCNRREALPLTSKAERSSHFSFSFVFFSSFSLFSSFLGVPFSTEHTLSGELCQLLLTKNFYYSTYALYSLKSDELIAPIRRAQFPSLPSTDFPPSSAWVHNEWTVSVQICFESALKPG